MKKLILATVAACITAPAFASDICAEHPKDQWMTEEAITALVTEQGYEVKNVKEEDGCWEVKGTKDVSVICHGDRRHLLARNLCNQIPYTGCTIEHRVLRMNM